MSNLPKHRFARIAASGAVTAIPTNVYKMVLVAGSGAAATLKLFNNADGSGTQVIECAAVTGTTESLSFEDTGPVLFSSKLYATLSGTGAVAYLWYD